MLSRKFFSNEMWEAARTFSECEAWLDLIQSARFEATDTIECIGGREITYGRGQYPASNRFLAGKWEWGEQKVKTFLAKLKRKGMITTDKSQGMNVITLVKYNEYNGNIPTSNPQSNPVNNLSINDLESLITQLISHRTTQCQPSDNPNNNKDNTLRESLNTRETLFDNFKNELLRDEEWRRYACQISGLSVAFNDLIPGELDNFLAWMVSTGEGDTLKTIDDVKRRFTYWWQGIGLRAYNQRHNGGTRKETFGGYTSHAGAYGKREAPAKTGVQPSEEARKDYTERF